MKVTNFSILGLYDRYDIKIPIRDNKLILTGVNGTGKSTVLSIFYTLITQQWNKLHKFEFNAVSIVIDDQEFVFERKQIEENEFWRNKALQSMPRTIYKRLSTLQEDYPKLLSSLINDKRLSVVEKRKISEVVKIPYERMDGFKHDAIRFWSRLELDEMENDLFLDSARKFADHTQDKVMFLPTFRRIEKDLKTILPDLDERQWKEISGRKETDRYLELVEFGMDDVVELVKTFTRDLSIQAYIGHENLAKKFLKEIVHGKIGPIQVSDFDIDILAQALLFGSEMGLDNKDIKALAKKVDDVRDQRAQIKSDDKFIMRYVAMLVDSIQSLEKSEIPIKQLINVCNKYLEGKDLTFERQNGVRACLKDGGEVDLKDLSSGEKQIISLLSHLYLGQEERYMVIIDEPELSLSVEWQSSLLPDILNTQKCSFIAAVTHSPFVFDNELEDYAVDIEDHKTIS